MPNRAAVPATIRDAVVADRARHRAWLMSLPVPCGEDRTLRPGDVRVCEVAGLRRHVVLLRPTLLHGRDVWQVRLAHSLVEMATENDRVYSRWRVAPYPLVVSSLRFVVVADEVGTERLGWVPPDAAGTPGARLTGPLDARWAFRQREGRDAARLQERAAQCALDWCDCPR